MSSSPSNAANRETNTHAQYLNSLFFPGIELLGAVAMTAILWVGGRMVADKDLLIGTLVSAVFLLNLIFQPLQELSDLYGQVQSAGAAMEKISLVLDTEPDIRDVPGAVQREIEGDVRLDHVTFSYGSEPVLHAIDIDIPAGSCLALVGESGGGKSTTAKLVGRFYDPDDGAIRIDGTISASSSSVRTGGSSASCSRIRSSSPGRSPTISGSRARRRPTPKSRTLRARWGSTGSHAGSTKGCRTRFVKAAPGSRPASAS